MTKKLLALFPFLLMHLFLFAQGRSVEMADTFRKEGKIYVVVAVILTIFAGIIIYLVRLDRKISKLENNKNKL